MATFEKVRVHLRGNPSQSREREALRSDDGHLYIRLLGFGWWRLSCGYAGWHSINVGVDATTLQRLQAEAVAATEALRREDHR